MLCILLQNVQSVTLFDSLSKTGCCMMVCFPTYSWSISDSLLFKLYMTQIYWIKGYLFGYKLTLYISKSAKLLHSTWWMPLFFLENFKDQWEREVRKWEREVRKYLCGR